MLLKPSTSVCRSAGTVFRRVFRSGDLYCEPFSDNLHDRLLLFPTDLFLLTEAQFACLARAAASRGEDWAFLTEIAESDRWTHAPSNVWILELTDYDGYADPQPEPSVALAGEAVWLRTGEKPTIGTVPNAIYSPNGEWGILVSDRDDALVAGSSTFMRIMRACLPMSQSEMLRKWVDEYRDEGETTNGWMAKVSQHLHLRDE